MKTYLCPTCNINMDSHAENDIIQHCPNCHLKWYGGGSLQNKLQSKRQICHFVPGGVTNCSIKSNLICPECKDTLYKIDKKSIFNFDIWYCKNEDGFLLYDKDFVQLEKITKKNHIKINKKSIEYNLHGSILAKQFTQKGAQDKKSNIDDQIYEIDIDDLTPKKKIFAMLSFPIKLETEKDKDFHALIIISLISINIIFYLLCNIFTNHSRDLIEKFSFQPLRFQQNNIKYFYTLISSLFMHANFRHILGNMYFLAAFGKDIEKKIGSLLFLLIYLMGGFICNYINLLFNNAPESFHLGASGAISVIMGLFLIFFPKEKYFMFSFYVPSFYFLGLWFTLQILNYIIDLGSPINFLAHIVGFALGVVAGYAIKPFCNTVTPKSSN